MTATGDEAPITTSSNGEELGEAPVMDLLGFESGPTESAPSAAVTNDNPTIGQQQSVVDLLGTTSPPSDDLLLPTTVSIGDRQNNINETENDAATVEGEISSLLPETNEPSTTTLEGTLATKPPAPIPDPWAPEVAQDTPTQPGNSLTIDSTGDLPPPDNPLISDLPLTNETTTADLLGTTTSASAERATTNEDPWATTHATSTQPDTVLTIDATSVMTPPDNPLIPVLPSTTDATTPTDVLRATTATVIAESVTANGDAMQAGSSPQETNPSDITPVESNLLPDVETSQAKSNDDEDHPSVTAGDPEPAEQTNTETVVEQKESSALHKDTAPVHVSEPGGDDGEIMEDVDLDLGDATNPTTATVVQADESLASPASEESTPIPTKPIVSEATWAAPPPSPAPAPSWAAPPKGETPVSKKATTIPAMTPDLTTPSITTTVPPPITNLDSTATTPVQTPQLPETPTPPQNIAKQSNSATAVAAPPIAPSAGTESTPTNTSSASSDEGPDPAIAARQIAQLQAALKAEQSKVEAATTRARTAEERAKDFYELVQAKKKLELELASSQKVLTSANTDKDNLLVELDKLRQARDEHERKQIVLSNRLNAAKKKEASKVNLSEELEDRVRVLEHEVTTSQTALREMTAHKERLETEKQSLSDESQERLKKAEAQLVEERRLNDERKKKMRTFVETKQEELREAKEQTNELNMELSQTNRSLREHHSRWKQLHAQWVQSQTRNRELQRDITRIKKESETMSRMENQMSEKLSQRAQETEEHKTKRVTAKQELMSVLEKLETERQVSSKLRDSIKFTFTPKALSQQQLLKESLRDFEHELNKLSQRLGKPVQQPPDTPSAMFALDEEEEDTTSSSRRSRSEIDSSHLLSSLEDETQRVSQCIMVLGSTIERLHFLIASSGERSCATLLTDLLMAGSAASAAAHDSEETASMTGPRVGAVGPSRNYGQVPSNTEEEGTWNN